LRRSICVTAIGALLALPAVAHGVTIGETFTPTLGGSQGLTNLQSTSPGGQYAAPSAGVITSWSFQAGPAQGKPDTLKLKVGRPLGNNIFTTVGESAPAVLQADALNTFPTQIPVQAGDVLGFYFTADGNGQAETGRAVAGYALHYFSGDPPPGTPASYIPFGPATQLNIAANLETTLCNGRAPTIAGGPGDDTLAGTEGPDVIVALEGNDSVSGLGGDDVVCGGTGKDKLRGGAGKDKLLGEGGKDKLKGGGGKDVCKGGGGRDSAGACEKVKSL
jgi:hypothetical protein